MSPGLAFGSYSMRKILGQPATLDSTGACDRADVGLYLSLGCEPSAG